MIIAKAINQEVVDNNGYYSLYSNTTGNDNTAGYYELFNPVEMTGVDGEKVTVLQSIGQYSISQLEQEKQNLLNEIEKIEEKITAIENL